MPVRDRIAIMRFVAGASAPAMVLVMLLSYGGLLSHRVARIDVLVLLLVGLGATFTAWALTAGARHRG